MSRSSWEALMKRLVSPCWVIISVTTFTVHKIPHTYTKCKYGVFYVMCVYFLQSSSGPFYSGMFCARSNGQFVFLIKTVQETDEPIIIGKAGKPVAILTAFKKNNFPRQLGGSWEGKVKISTDKNKIFVFLVPFVVKFS